jgi:hypothetical protein
MVHCSVEGCSKKVYTRGMCSMHYMRLKRHGSTAPAKRFHGTPEQRFWAKVKRTADCWGWEGGKHHWGYGIFHAWYSHAIVAHRFSYMLHYGPIPKGALVCHHCDNPECTNPEHLFLGDQQANMDDMHRKGRGAIGSKNGLAKLSESQVVAIRADSRSSVVLGKIYGVSSATVRRVKRRELWVHV